MADIIDAGELKPGTVYLYKGELLSVVDIIHNKTAMAKRKHKIKAKNLRSGAISERMLFSGETVERAEYAMRTELFNSYLTMFMTAYDLPICMTFI